jgi:vancomycin resistance protein YoaR
MAQLVNGTVIRPGEVFSVDAVVGRLTTGKGFVLAPYMVDGKGECCTVGGGVSQFGTTIFNAAFWGGYEILEHQPHSAWISRYPLGIEATLVYHSKDVKFRNDTYNTLTVKTSTTGTSLTVEIWGNQGGWRVRGNHSIGNRSSAITILDQGGSVAKRVKASVSGSAPGLVTVTRTLTQNGVAHSQSWTNRYLDPDA